MCFFCQDSAKLSVLFFNHRKGNDPKRKEIITGGTAVFINEEKKLKPNRMKKQAENCCKTAIIGLFCF